MRSLEKELENKKLELNKLIDYGFKKNNNKYIYTKRLSNDNFLVHIEITDFAKITSKIMDIENKEEYLPVDIKNTTGSFIGKIKEEYENILKDVISICTERDVFKSKQAQSVIKYVKEKYAGNLEFLWEKSNNAIIRHHDTKKWYLALLTIPREKLGLKSNDLVEIIDLKMPPKEIVKLVDNKKIFPGYHMNKKHWITICLDNTMKDEELFKYIDISYNLK